MALIKCPECGHEISEYANKCISCGYPMGKIKEILERTKNSVVSGDSVIYSPTKELTSSFNLVPTNILDECLNKLNSLEEIY